MTIYQKAIQAIRSHPYTFLYHPDFQTALQFLKAHNNDQPTASEGHTITAYDPRKIALLPIELDRDENSYNFNWQMPRDEHGPEFVSLMFDALENLPIATESDAETIKIRYPRGTKIKAEPKDDFLSPGTYTVDFVDDAGQIHVVESGIAIIPEIDEINYICTQCGKEFDYPPAISRSDNHSYICRVCSAEEALDVAGVKEKDAILDEIRKHENG